MQTDTLPHGARIRPASMDSHEPGLSAPRFSKLRAHQPGFRMRAQLSLKRLLDVWVSLICLSFSAPLWLVIAIAIKLESPGPVFFVHKRPGLRGRHFSIYKFRTMTLDAERAFQHLKPEQRREFARWGKICTDPRVTQVGAILRRYSLDELPQFLNILRGDMSLVGPRPYLRSQVREMGQERDVIYCVKPGLTGLWQVSGRNSIPFEQRIELDVKFVREWSLWRDLVILVRTPIVLITGRGAY